MSNRTPRRRFLRVVGSGAAIALAGCSGGDSGNGGGGGGTETGTSTAPADSTASNADERTATAGTNANDSVPKRYKTAKSLAGKPRNPESLTPKTAVGYRSQKKGGHGCSGCEHFIKPKGDDDAGACTLVEGRIKSDAWCKLFSPTG